MNVQNVISGLNNLLALEYAGVFQYLQYSYLVQGPEREYLRPFFRDRAKEGFEKHSKKVADKIVAMGGTPTLQPAQIAQAQDMPDMLNNSLELERSAQRAQKELLNQVQDDVPLRLMLEEMILDEQQDIEHLEG
jgi:bacterioferritin